MPGGKKNLCRESPQKTEPYKLAQESVFMKACRGEQTPYTPVWLMRQAGRYMSEYRELRANVGFLELCKRPDLACAVTVMAAQKLEVDAAIVFADILLILEPLGVGLEFTAGDGPVIKRPLRSAKDVNNLLLFKPEQELDFIFQTIGLCRLQLSADMPLIGFAGAPFTLASYLIEGGASRDFHKVKRFMHSDPLAWHELMSLLTDLTIAYLNAQIKAGAQAVQLFDSWVGCLSPDDYREFVLPHMRRTIFGVVSAPVIHFGVGAGHLLELMAEAGGQVMGLDWRINLHEARTRLGPSFAVQGNLDPAILLADKATIRSQALKILERNQAMPGHIFNLGHGVLPGTDVDKVRYLVDIVHELSRK